MSADETQLRGTLVDGHRVEERIGAGGTGTVWCARHPETGASIAVKVLDTRHRLDGDAAARFLRESRLEELKHPNIVRVHSAGFLDDGRPYLTMELLEGESLEARFRREGPLPVADAVAIGRDVLAGLGAAHRAGVVHRDVKPANVFLARGPEGAETAKLLDFSVARIASTDSATVTASGDVVGTPLYLAPEQATGIKGQDGRIDIWAVGVLLYHVLTGEPPFASKRLAELILKVVSEEPVPPAQRREDLPADLCAVVMKAMRKPREARYASAEAMADALGAVRLVP